ncbi:GNAT family N-acetyltransferase [Streptomyces sp. NPDC001922]|uniref:GNAT family N-acetyltransferase n=1 Tax=Streptomyces sp. NPDC001922 TaxID=3364624 RepID=UPI0036AEE407
MNRHIPLPSGRLHNFRDLGGYSTDDGRTVRWGRMFRSDSLGKLQGEDWERFLALGIRTVIDLRHSWEIEAKGRIPEHPSFTYHHLSVEHRPYDQAGLGAEVQTGPFLAERYLEVAEDGVRELRRALEVIAAEDGPVVFHCTSGKDRTGLLAALVLDLLGVSEADIVADFALTGLATQRLLADWRTDHGGREPAWPGYGRAPGEVMSLFLAALAQRHGSVHNYTGQVLGPDGAQVVSALRRNLLEPAPHTELSFRRADERDLSELVRLRDAAADWQIAHGIDQWKPGQLGEDHFRARLEDGEVWIATLAPDGPVAGAWELWWEDRAAWGHRPPNAGYVHRLMTDRRVAPPGAGRRMLAEAERRVAATGREVCRLDCLASNPRLRTYYEAAGYTVVDARRPKDGGLGSVYDVTLLEKQLRPDPEPAREL